MAELNKIFLDSGLPGVEAHFKKQIEENDRKWFKLFLLICILYIGFWCIRQAAEEQDIKRMKIEMSKQKSTNADH